MNIPHQPPYRFITSAALEGEGRGAAEASSAASPAQLIEIAAQACAALESLSGEEVEGGVLAGVRGFTLPARAPEGPLRIEAERLRALGAQRMWRARVSAGGARVAEGALIFSR